MGEVSPGARGAAGHAGSNTDGVCVSAWTGKCVYLFPVLGTLTKLWCRMFVILSEAKNLVLGAEQRPFAPLRVT